MTPGERKKKYPIWDRDCTLCGAPLCFAKTNAGAMIPLDLRAPVYQIFYERSDAHSGTVVVRTAMAYVSHFATCPYADEFSKEKTNA